MFEDVPFVIRRQDLIELENLVNIPKGQSNYASLKGKNNNKRGNHRIAQYFKNSVPRSVSVDPGLGHQQRNYSRHHVYPNANIFDLPDLFDEETVQDYINQPHIKRIIRDYDLAGKFRPSEIIHTAIGYNPHNLVHGPSRPHRENDPADENGSHVKIDHEIKNAQSFEYRQRMDEFARSPTLNSFARIPEPQPVVWRKNPHSRKYYIG